MTHLAAALLVHGSAKHFFRLCSVESNRVMCYTEKADKPMAGRSMLNVHLMCAR